MRWSLMIAFLLLSLGLAAAQEGTPATQPSVADPLQLIEDARIMYVARELRLRADQVQKIIPLLNKAQERIAQRKQALDDLWVKGQATLAAVDQAMIAGNQPNRAMQNAAEKLVTNHDGAIQDANKDLDALAGQVLAVLDKQQLARVEGRAAGQRPNDNSGLIDDIGAYVSAMRGLLADEYDTLRVPVALQLAGRLVSPDANGFNDAVGAVLRLMDAVRQRSDAQFAQDQLNMRQIVARALGLRDERPTAAFTVSYDDLTDFVTNPRTATLLTQFKPEPPMEVVP